MSVSAAGYEPAAADPVAEAKALYRKGKTAFDVGRWEDAVNYFEESYAQSGNELLLFNIGLSYYRWWEETGEIAHLRKARSVLKTFVARAQRNPDKLGDPAEAVAQLNEVEAKLEQAETEAEARRTRGAAGGGTEQGADTTPPAPSPDPADPAAPVDTGPVAPVGEDPGKGLRLGGAVSMALGGVGIVTGVIVGAIHVGNSVKFDRQLRETDDEIKASGITQKFVDDTLGGCSKVDADVNPDAARFCDLQARRTAIVNNGKRANLFAALGFGLGGGLGVALLATGVALYAIGNKKTKAWKDRHALRVAPVFDGRFAGIGIAGRF